MTLLIAEILAVGLLVIGLYQLKARLGLALLFIFVGSNQFIQNLLVSTVYVDLFGGYSVSPGSAVLFSSSLYALLLIHVREDIPTTRKLIAGIVLANLSLAAITLATKWGLFSGQFAGSPNADWFLEFHTSAYLVGTALLIIDTFLLVVLYEFLVARARWIPLLGRIWLSLLLVLAFDAILFVTLAPGLQAGRGQLLTGNLLGKMLAGTIYGLMLWGYLRWTGEEEPQDVSDTQPLSIFTYRRHLAKLHEAKKQLELERQREHELRSEIQKDLEQSEAKYRQLVELAREGIWVIDKDAQTTFVNPSMAEMLGYSQEEMAGRHLFSFMDERGVDIARRNLERRRQGFDEQHDFELLRRDGSRIHVTLATAPITDEQGEYAGYIAGVLDITERKQSEMALRESEQRYELAAASGRVGIWDWNLETNEIYVEPRLKGMLGYQDHEIRNHLDDWGKLVHPGDAELVMSEAESHLEGRSPRYEIAHRMLHKDGSIRWFLARGKAIRGGDGRPIRMVGTDTDITERVEVEYRLERLRQRYHDLFQDAPEMYVLTRDRDGVPVISDCNRQFLRRLGYELDEVVGHALAEFYTPASRNELLDRRGYQRALRGELGASERQLLAKGGEIVEALLKARPETDASGKVVGTRAVYVDITERKRAEEKLQKSREQLRNLAIRLNEVREQERTRVAREIHDELGQALTGLKMDLGWLTGKLTDRQPSLMTRLESMDSLIDRTIEVVRELASRLRPSVLDDLGLVAAIEWQAKQSSSRSGIDCRVSLEVEDVAVDGEKSTAIFRILQEALTNVLRHAAATRVDVSLRLDDDNLVLEVLDDGHGITEDQVWSSKSLGLIGMRERAGAFGGRVEIASSEGGGCAVSIRIPM